MLAGQEHGIKANNLKFAVITEVIFYLIKAFHYVFSDRM